MFIHYRPRTYTAVRAVRNKQVNNSCTCTNYHQFICIQRYKLHVHKLPSVYMYTKIQTARAQTTISLHVYKDTNCTCTNYHQFICMQRYKLHVHKLPSVYMYTKIQTARAQTTISLYVYKDTNCRIQQQ